MAIVGPSSHRNRQANVRFLGCKSTGTLAEGQLAEVYRQALGGLAPVHLSTHQFQNSRGARIANSDTATCCGLQTTDPRVETSTSATTFSPDKNWVLWLCAGEGPDMCVKQWKRSQCRKLNLTERGLCKNALGDLDRTGGNRRGLGQQYRRTVR